MKKIMNFIRKYYLGILVVLASLLGLLYTTNTPPKLVESTPTAGQSSVDLNAEVVLTFDRAVDIDRFQIVSTPQESFTISSLSPKTIKLSHKNSFYQNTPYVVTINYRNRLINTLTFETARSESNPRALQLIQEEVERDYPLAEKLPYTTENFQVVYIEPLTLRVELYQESLSQSLIKQELVSWIKSEGVDPSSHEFVFLLPESPTPTTYH